MRRFLSLLVVALAVAAASLAQEGPATAPVDAASPAAGSPAPAASASPSFANQSTAESATRALSLADALALAEGAGEGVRVAEAEVERAQAQRRQARSERFPQLDASGSYSRTLRSEFEDISFDFGDDAGSGDLGDLPFGQRNQYRLGLVLNQTLWSAGRIGAQTRAADAGLAAARTGLAATRAELALDVTQAYFDALLLDRLVNISQATLEQADRAYEQTKLARQVGNQSEFELLRAQVARDNERPQLVQRRADRDLAYARLAQLLDLPPEQPLQLTTSFVDFATWEARGAVPAAAERPAWLQRLAAERAPVRQAQAAVDAQEQQVKIARALRLPSVGATSDYGRVAYPAGGLPAWSDTRTNWTVGLGLRVPLLTGGRLAAEEGAVRAVLDQTRARLDQVRELAWLDGRDALDRLAAAEAVYQAAFGTVAQAQRAYEIAELRYREGLSTQLELNDTRIQLTFAQGNAALAARNLQVTRARVALLPDLPLGAGANSTLTAASFGVSGPGAVGAPTVVTPAAVAGASPAGF
jgi:outer membrane protein TolC